MRDEGSGPADHQWGRFGFLIADFFTLLAMLFLVANTVGHVPVPPPKPKPKPTVTHVVTVGPTATPVICGLNPIPLPNVTVTLSDDADLRNVGATGVANHAAEAQAAAEIKAKISTQFGASFSGAVGLAEVWGGSFNGNLDTGDGTDLAKGAINSLQLLATQGYLFTSHKTIYQSLWLGTIQSNQIMLTLFLYNVTLTNTCSNS